MPDLRLHGRAIGTVFDLLGDRENDLTYSLGWGLARNEHFARQVLGDIFPGDEVGELLAVRLQEFQAGGGITDIEIESEHLALVLEAKRGWDLPVEAQLATYAPRVSQAKIGRIVVLSEASPEFAEALLPQAIAGVPVVYRSWKQMVSLGQTCLSQGTHAERRLLRELLTYLQGLMTIQNKTSNIVYVVSLGTSKASWSGSLTPVEIVTSKGRYFHPVGNGYPKEPPNYLGFRWSGRLQQIHFVESYEVFTVPHQHIVEIPSKGWERHFIYTLGPPIIPPHTVRTGNLYRAQRVEAALDLLLTSETIAEARDRTRDRLRSPSADAGH